MTHDAGRAINSEPLGTLPRPTEEGKISGKAIWILKLAPTNPLKIAGTTTIV